MKLRVPSLPGPLGLVLVFGSGILASGSAYGQSWDDFHVKKFFGELGVELELRDESIGSGPGARIQKEVIPRGKLTLGTFGYYYHPKLVEYDLRATLQFQQQWIYVDGPQPDQSYNNIFPNWDMRVRLFKDQPYWGEIYSQRSESWTRQNFFPTIRSTVTETGANIGATEWLIPSNFHYHHNTFETRGASVQNEVRDAFTLGGGKSFGKHNINYLTEYNAVQLKHREQAYDDFNLRLSSKHLLGDNDSLTWLNRATTRRQVGDLDTSYASASSGLNKRFSPNVDGETALEFDRFSSSTSDSQSLRWRGQARHRLFKSLTSTGSARASRTSVGGGDISVHGFGGTLDYTKKVPVGRLGLRYGLDYYVQDQGDLAGQTPIFQEAHIYTLGVPILLDNQFVDTASVTITDATGLILYTEALDYFLLPQGNQLRVDIPVGSLILPGQTILISYSFRPSPSHSFATTTHSTGFDFDYGDIADVRIGYQTTSQDLVSGTNPGNLTDTVTTTADLQVHPFSTTLGAHYRRYDSDFAPYERRALRFSFDHDLWERSMWGVRAENYQTNFPDEAANEDGSTLQALVTSSFWGSSLLDLRADWFKINYRADKGDGYSLELTWRRRIRDLEISLRLRYVDEQFLIATDQQITAAFFSLTRKF